MHNSHNCHARGGFCETARLHETLAVVQRVTIDVQEIKTALCCLFFKHRTAANCSAQLYSGPRSILIYK